MKYLLCDRNVIGHCVMIALLSSVSAVTGLVSCCIAGAHPYQHIGHHIDIRSH